MIITGSKVNLAASHRYEKTVVYQSQTVSWGGMQTGITAQQSFTSAYSTRQQFYASATTGATDFYLPNRAGVNGDWIASSTYTRNAAFTGSRITNRLGARPQLSSGAAVSPEASGPSGWYGNLRRQTIGSIWDLICNLRRGKFENSAAYNNTVQEQQSSAAQNISSAPETAGFKPVEVPTGVQDASTLTLSNGLSLSTWSVSQRISTYMAETECTAFSGEGIAVTADGRTLPFNVEFELSRSYTEYSELTYVSQYTTILTDPLVINLTDNPAQVTDQTFFFDLDGDGEQEELSQLAAGSGYLALDKNNDGVINDGSELFGTASGDGFKDLAAYDSDGNGWIDEADEVYSRLKIWTRDADGRDQLISLKEADVGAIYLGSTQTPFEMTDDENGLTGRVRQSGVYLHENGVAGSVQQIDF